MSMQKIYKYNVYLNMKDFKIKEIRKRKNQIEEKQSTRKTYHPAIDILFIIKEARILKYKKDCPLVD